MAWRRWDPVPIHRDGAGLQRCVRHSAEAGLDPPRDRDIKHRSLQFRIRCGGLGGRGPIQQRDRRGDRHQQGTAVALELAGAHPAALQGMEVHAEGRHRAGAAGMAAGQPAGMGLMGAARADHPADAPTHQHRRTRAQEGQARHRQTDAVGSGGAEEGIAEGAQQGAPGGVDHPFGTAHCHHTVLHDAPVQKEPAVADPFEVEAGVEFPAGLQRGGVAGGAQLHAAAGQQGGERLGAAVAETIAPPDREHQIAAGPTGQGRHPIDLGFPGPDRRIGGPQVQHQTGLVGEGGLRRHHHIGGAIGLGQPHLGHQAAEIGGHPHPQHPAPLTIPQLLLTAVGQIGKLAPGRPIGGGAAWGHGRFPFRSIRATPGWRRSSPSGQGPTPSSGQAPTPPI